MPTPFPFVSGAVLTASNLNSISELPTRTLTGSGAAVAADSYSRVILNGTSITYTVNTSTFTAGQVVELYNANSTAATIAAGAGVTLNGAAGLTLAQYQTAELYAISATSFVLWKSDVTVSAGGLVFVTSQTIGSAVSSVTVSSAFSSTYDNYRIIVSGGTGSTNANLAMTLGATATGYYGYGTFGAYNTGTPSGTNNNNDTAWGSAAGMSANSLHGVIDLTDPFNTKRTHITVNRADSLTTGNSRVYGGFLDNATSYTAFTLTTSTGTMTGGTVRVYGYANS